MRERKNYNERTKVKSNDQVRIKYFLVFEGSQTEEIYFNAIDSNKCTLGINPIIELVPLIRDFGETGWSNPKKMVDRVIENVSESEGIMTYEVLLNRIHDFMTSTAMIKDKSDCKNMWKLLLYLCEYKLCKKLDEEISDVDNTVIQLFDLIYQNTSLEMITDNIAEVIKSLSMTYDNNIDRICLIVDRDKDSFVVNQNKDQYKYVLEACERNNFDLYVTNPCFEFWLLLHFDNCENLDKLLLKENRKVKKSKKRYAEYELCKCMNFKKNSYDANTLVKSLEKAIDNEKKFCEDLENLKTNVGSNLGKLFEKIIGNK